MWKLRDLVTNLRRKDIVFRCTTQCQDVFDLPKQSLMEEPNLCYPDPNKAYTLMTDESNYAWICEIEGKKVVTQSFITFQIGLFKRNTLN